MCREQGFEGGGQIIADNLSFTSHQVVGPLVRRKWTTVSWCQVLEQLDSRSGTEAQSGNPQPCSEHIIQMLLLCAVVLAFAGNAHAQQITIETQACFGVAHHNCRVIDAEKQVSANAVPFRIALVWRELQDLQRMSVRIFEVESADASGAFVPLRQK